MLERLVYADWEAPPDVMGFEEPLGGLMERIQALLPRILAGKEAALQDPASAPSAYWDDCLELYLLTPALVNVALNYKICLEQGLPLHPTHYFEVNDLNRHARTYPKSLVAGANSLFLRSIGMARAIYGLEPAAAGMMEAYRRDLPVILHNFIYVSMKDKYTWRASEPRKIALLARDVLKKMQPAIVVGAAHGSIMSGLVFSNLVNAPLYFIRFSMFKRNDKFPIISASDRAFLAAYRRGPALLFDEDVAKGTTLTMFGDALRPLFKESATGSVLRHSLSPCWPDFTGSAWND